MCFFSYADTFVRPRSRDEDTRRRELILNILLLTLSGLFFVVSCFSLYQYLTLEEYRGLVPVTLLALCFVLLALYALSRVGFPIIAAHLFIGVFFLLPTYAGYRWGVDVSASVLFYALTIVISGILVSTRFAFFVTFLIGVTLSLIVYLHAGNVVKPNRYWTVELWDSTDIVVTVLIFLIIATISWLSNREIEGSLNRARTSEAALKDERDLLEVRVRERTKELRQAEMEKMSQAYRFVEFGRLASGLFHDLMNPLTALSLNINQLAKQNVEDKKKLSTFSEDVIRAKQATEHMQKLMDSMRKYLAREGIHEQFSLTHSLEEVVQVLTPYARERGVSIQLAISDEVRTHGDPVAFVQVMTNLISNAVDSYTSISQNTKRPREVLLRLEQLENTVLIDVHDFGSGISANVQAHLFEPFFTTKVPGKGLGIGLSLAKRIVEKEFNGSLTVKSSIGVGSTFTIQFPLREPRVS